MQMQIIVHFQMLQTLGSPLWCVMMTHSLMGRNDRCVCTSSA